MVCRSNKEPDYTNQCSSAIGDTYVIPDFCNANLPSGQAYTDRENACKALSDFSTPSEWGNSAPTGAFACNYQNGTTNKCLSGGVSGTGVQCQRLAFTGNAYACCTRDYDSNKLINNCFDTDDKINTCAPEYRGYTQTGCQVEMENSCLAGDPPTSDPRDSRSFTSNWYPNETNSGVTGQPYCVLAIQQNLAKGGGNREYAQKLMASLYQKYLNSGFTITTPNMPGYNLFQERLLELSILYPDAAAPYLQNTLCSQYTREELSQNLDLTKFCGCYLPPSQYNEALNAVGISKECDPICNIASAIPPVDPVSGNTIKCKNNICVIDDTTINLVNSRVGNISLGQVCGGCSTGSCNCSIIDVNISATGSKIGNIDLSQECGGNLNCFQTTSAGVKPVDCATYTGNEDIPTTPEDETIATSNYLKYVLIAVGVIFVILIIVIVIFALI